MLADAPGKDQASKFFGSRGAPGDYFEFVFSDAAGVGVLKEQAAGNVFDDRARRCVADLNEAQILFGRKALARFRGEGGRSDGFDEELGDLFGRGFSIDVAIDADDSAECGDGIARERLLIGLENRWSRCGAAGIGVLDDDDGRLVEFLRKFPAGIEVDEVVEAELFALQLRCAGDAEAGAICCRARRPGGDSRRNAGTGPTA